MKNQSNRGFTYIAFLFLFVFYNNTFSQNNTQAPLAINLAGVASWEEGFAFVDIMKVSRTWISQCSGCDWGTGDPLPMDSLDWVTSLPAGHWAETVMLDGNPAKPAGRYTLLFDGAGTFDFNGDVLSQTLIAPGHIELEVSEGTAGIWLRIMATDPNSVGDYLRNIRLILPGYENTYQAEPFYPPFLETWKDFQTIRFMDWGSTNNNPIITWSERTTPEHQTQSRHAGVALEYMVQLCNLLQTNAWVCIPHQADNNYVSQMATYLRDNLDAGLKVYIEYSNEVWNWQFVQATYAVDQGAALGIGNGVGENQAYYYAHRSVEIFNLFEAAFGNLNRLERVIAWQNFSTYWSPLILDYNNTWQSTDAFAIAPYFGGFLGNPETQDAVAAMTTDEILDLCEDQLAYNMDGCRQQAEIANSRGLSLIAYEGGQHLVGYSGAENNTALEAALVAANRSPRMQKMYLEYYNRWKEIGGELFAVFSSMGEPSKWGSWGLLENYEEDYWAAPKYAATMQFNDANNPAWWLSPATTTIPCGEQLIAFDGGDLPALTINQNRVFTNTASGQMLPFSLANGDHLFNTGDPQSEFYGGMVMDFGTDPIGGTTYTLSNYGSNDYFIMGASTGASMTSCVDGIFLWKKEQFLNNYDVANDVTVGKMRCNIRDFVSNSGTAEFRFVIKDNGNYYISDFMTWDDHGFFEMDLFNNSERPGRRWYPFNPAVNDFAIPPVLVAPEAVSFNNVEAVGFALHADREYHTAFSFDLFEVYTRPAEEFTVRLNQHPIQVDPTDVLNIVYTAIFGESTSDFASSDVQISGSATDAGTTATVTEVAPMDGTTYEITIQNLVQNGFVIVDIPANVATNNLGYFNLMATTTDNVVSFNGANNPTVSLEQGTGQTDPTLDVPVYFTATFDMPVSGFDASDLLLAGTANPTTASITEVAPMDGTTYSIAVSGMMANGMVTISLPANNVFSTNFNLGNKASTSIDNTVEVIIDPLSAATLIDFQGANIPDEDLSENRFLETSVDGLACEMPFDTTMPIWTSSYDQAAIYGGASLAYEMTPDCNFQMRTNDTGFEPNRFWCQVAGSDGESTVIDLLFLWQKDQFLNNMHLYQVGFDNDISNSSLTINVTGKREMVDLRFVIQNNGIYYMSEFTSNDLGWITLNDFNNNSLAGKRWAVINPSNNNFQIPVPLPVFRPVNFDHVTAVGFIMHSVRDTYSQYFSFDTFQANGINLSHACQSDLTFTSLQTDDHVYQAGNTISSTAVLGNGVAIEYKAGVEIYLDAGFEVPVNAVFSAEIEGCD